MFLEEIFLKNVLKEVLKRVLKTMCYLKNVFLSITSKAPKIRNYHPIHD